MLNNISFIYFYHAAGFFLDRYHKHRFGLLCIANFIFGLTTVITPYAGTLVGLLFCTGICGMSMAILFTGGHCIFALDPYDAFR